MVYHNMYHLPTPKQVPVKLVTQMPAIMGGNKVLVLHGNRQTGELLLGRLAKLQKAVAHLQFQLEFVAPDAPFLYADGDEDLEESHHDNDDSTYSSLRWQRTWWHRKGNTYHGLEESITKIEQIWNADGGFVGVLGFSQGSQLAHIISILHAVTNGDSFRGLRSVVHVSGYNSPMPPNLQTYIKDHWSEYNNNFDENVIISLTSLHIMGATDQIVPIQDNKELSDLYNKPMIHIHQGGHHVPVKARDIEQYLIFWRKLQSIDEPVETKILCPDEEHTQAQIDEVSAMSQIFPAEFHLLSETEFIDPGDTDPEDYSEESRKYAHPISYTILLQPEDGEMQQELWPPKAVALQVQYPSDYPDCSPIITLQHQMNYLEFSMSQSELLMKKLMLTMKDEEGMPCVMSLIYAAREFFEEGGLAKAHAALPHSVIEDVAIENDLQGSSLTSPLLPSSDAKMKKCRQEGWLISRKMMEGRSINTGKGGSWKQFTIGLVGKPSAGKSTFFNAATAFARQRGVMPATNNDDDDEDNDGTFLGGAAMAPHPFTTIDPNVGFCFVPSVDGSCPEDDAEGCDFLASKGIFLGSCHGRTDGRRLIPILLKDVAGLVPGAYEGRGKGNKFLDDLTDADVLIHVLDASGKADSEGNKVLDVINPINDLEWISNEIIAWVYTNIKEKWDSVVRRGRTKLLKLFSGYKQSQSFVEEVFTAVENHVRENDGRDTVFDKLESFDEGDLYRLVSAFVFSRFPMGLALNKIDKPSSIPFVEEITSKLPLHGCFVGQALSADKEMRFIRHHCLHQETALESHFEGSVWKCLQKTLSLRGPLLVFPVADMQTYAPLLGLNNFATRDPSLPSKGFINCLTAAGGAAPTTWDYNKEKYIAQGKNEKKHALRDVILMKPGSTINDVFLTLKNKHVLEGEFVRAEAASKLGEKPKLVSKIECLSNENRILMIMTTKRQKK